MPQMSLRAGKPIHERTPADIIWMFGVIPILFGSGLLILACVNLVQHAGSFLWQDWLGVVWAVVVAAVLSIGLPATGWRELQRRRHARDAEEKRAETAHRRGEHT